MRQPTTGRFIALAPVDFPSDGILRRLIPQGEQPRPLAPTIAAPNSQVLTTVQGRSGSQLVLRHTLQAANRACNQRCRSLKTDPSTSLSLIRRS